MSSQLQTERGARLVDIDEFREIEAPQPQGRWYPISHGRVLDVTVQALANTGFEVEKTQLALSPDSAKFFGTLDLRSDVCEGVRLAVGVRNSIDKSFPIGFCCGERCLVCDNMAFASEIEVLRVEGGQKAKRRSTGFSSLFTKVRQDTLFSDDRTDRQQRRRTCTTGGMSQVRFGRMSHN